MSRSISTPRSNWSKCSKGRRYWRMTGCSSRLTGMTGSCVAAGAADVGAPGGQPFAALRHREGLIVGHVIHLAAEGVEGGHAVPFGFGQQHERQRQIGRALPRDRPALLHGSGLRLGRVFRADRRQTAGFGKCRVAWPVAVA